MARSRGGSRSGGSRSSSSRSGGGSRSSGSRSSGSSHGSYFSGSSYGGGYSKHYSNVASRLRRSNSTPAIGNPIFSTRPIAGTKKYEIVDKDGSSKIIYTNYDLRSYEIKSAIRNRWAAFVIVLAISLIFIIGGLFTALYIPRNIHTGSTNPAIIIDNLGVVKDEAYLISTMTQYYKETGIEVALYTCPHSDWEDYYDHQGIFCDEKYWAIFHNDRSLLLLYSEPLDAEFVDWEWSLTMGDDTLATASDAYLDCLEGEITKQLNEEDPCRAMVDALISSLDDRKIEFNFLNGIPYWVFACFWLGLAVRMLFKTEGRRYYPDAKLIEEPRVELIKCSYCTGTYGSDVVDGCPHCGAPVKLPAKET